MRASPAARAASSALTALAVFLPLGLIFYQSLLDAPFFAPHKRRPRRVRASSSPTRDFWDALKQLARHRRRHGADRRAARRHPRVPDGAHRPARARLDRAAAADPGVRLADGARLRLRRLGRAGRLLLGVGEGAARRRALERLLADRHRHHRRADPRAARLPLLVVGAEEPRLRRRGGGAHGRLVAVPGRPRREPADGHAVAALLRRARLLPRLRDLRPAARARRPGRPPRARDLPLQADQQARHAVVPPDGGGRGVHRRDHVPARDAAALPAEERRQVRHRQGQGRPPAAAAARRLALGRGGDPRRSGCSSPSSCRSRGSCCARSSPTGAKASASPTC